MQRIFKAIQFISIFGVLAALPVLGRAADVETNYPMSKIVMPELLIGVGTRGAAMGGAGAVFSDDVDSLFWNPAGLGKLKSIWMEMAHNSLFQDVSQEFVGVGVPISKEQTIAAGFHYLNLGAIDKTDITNDGRLIQGLGSVGLSMMGFNLGIGTQNEAGLAFGAAGKYFTESLGDKTLKTFAFDAGVQFPLEAGPVFAVVLQNLGMAIDGYSLPMEGRLGVGQTFKMSANQNFSAALEAEVPVSALSQYQFHLGGEYGFSRWFFARAGYTVSDVNSLGSMSGLAAGLGLNLGGWRLGYTFVPLGIMGYSHRISLGIDFEALAASMRTKPETKAKTKKHNTSDPRMSFTVGGKTTSSGSLELPKRSGRPQVTSSSEDERMMRSLVKQSLSVEVGIQGRSSEPDGVRFTVKRGAGPKIASWMLKLTDMADQTIASLSGTGLPEEIAWNVKNKDGQRVKNLYELSYDLVLVDVNNEQETTSGMLEQQGGGAPSMPAAPGVTQKKIVPINRPPENELAKEKKIAVIYFESGRAEITSEASEKIGSAVEQMKKYPRTKIRLEGFCDPGDEKATALLLSKNRAEAVQRYLTAYYKIALGRILVQPKADKEPVVHSEDERLRDKNRRVEITLQPSR